MGVLVLGIALAVLDGTILNLALPDIARSFSASAPHAIWVVNAYQIATLVMLLPLATLGDLIGYRRVYLCGMALFALASLGAMVAPSLELLIAARALQGLGAAGVMSVNAALVRLIFAPGQLGRGMAINSMVVATASVAGPTVAAAILSVADWPWLFALNLPLGLLVMLLGRRALPPNVSRAAPGARIAPLDVLLNVLMFALIFLGADRLAVRDAGAAALPLDGLALLAAGLLVGAVHVQRQRRRVAPLFPVDLLRIPVFALSMGASVSAFSAQTLAYLSLPFLLLDSWGRSHLQAGLLITAWPLAIVAMGPVVARLIGRVPDGLMGGAGMVLMAFGLSLLALLPDGASDLSMVWRLALCGVGFALFQSPNNHTIVRSAPLSRSGAASGMQGTARLTGQTLGAVLLAGIFSLWPPQAGQGPLIALGLAAVCALAAGVFSVLRVR
ncbi:MFS transporter [Xenophilus arseniciresistens]|uniref:MFS transporter n=2 Tax=Xenophilus arseniciresistens TaxID=1283306 RepID=A0AAE3SZZ0_9BURK|nr:MFS transporter [Xenophilus arseniciresistens]MDA7417604.1 MFS transporter [Xenophilus arseniciresistens]